MTNRRDLFRWLLPILGGLLLCGCAGSGELTERDRLTPDEEKRQVEQIREYFVRSRQFNLTEADREQIRKNQPDVHVKYDGYKNGWLSVRWSLPNYRVLLLQRQGDLRTFRPSTCVVRIISDQASGKIPKHFFGANGEDISLPPE